MAPLVHRGPGGQRREAERRQRLPAWLEALPPPLGGRRAGARRGEAGTGEGCAGGRLAAPAVLCAPRSAMPVRFRVRLRGAPGARWRRRAGAVRCAARVGGQPPGPGGRQREGSQRVLGATEEAEGMPWRRRVQTGAQSGGRRQFGAAFVPESMFTSRIQIRGVLGCVFLVRGTRSGVRCSWAR